MDTSEFEAALHRDGYTEVARRSLAPHHETTPHAHAFDVRALVIEGAITLIVDGTPTRYPAGTIFTMAHDREHSEQVGPEGVTSVSGRRYGG